MEPVILRDYQDNAISRMKLGCILNGDVGSGKSYTALAYYYYHMGGTVYYKKRDDDGNFTIGPYIHGSNELVTECKYTEMINPIDIYIITTAKKRDSHEWEDELKRIGVSVDKDSIYSNKVIIDSWNNISKYVQVEHSFFIFDEQRVVGYGAWVKSFLIIAKHNPWILLTATPGDRWEDYIPVFIANGFYKNKTQFQREHMVFSRFTMWPQVTRYLNEAHLVRLKRSILVHMDFNRKTIQHHEYVRTQYDTILYSDITDDYFDYIHNKPIESTSEFCQILRYIVNSDESRQIACDDLVHKRRKTIIFYNYDYELFILRNLFRDYPHAEWNGHKHEDVPTGDKWVYLVQYTSGCEGWNCITTDTIIFYSENYSYRVMTQAAGRIDRLNTPYTDLYYYHMVSTAKIDKAIQMALLKKKKFNESNYANKFKKENATNVQQN